MSPPFSSLDTAFCQKLFFSLEIFWSAGQKIADVDKIHVKYPNFFRVGMRGSGVVENEVFIYSCFYRPSKISGHD